MGNYLNRGIKNDIKCDITDKNTNKWSTICTGIKNMNCMEYNYYTPTNKSIKRSDFIVNFIKNNKNIDTIYINVDESKSMRVVVDGNILYETSYDLHTESNPDLQKVLQFISKSVFSAYKEASKAYILERGTGKKYRIEIGASWFITYESGGFVAPHTHDNCSWSCVYYVQSAKDSNKKNGATWLSAPHSRLSSDIGSESFQHQLRNFEPIEGKLVVWPSYIIHGSYPHIGKVKKTILSANLIIKLKDN